MLSSQSITSIHAAAAAKSHHSCPTLCDPIDSSPPGSHPWDSPGKNTGVGCYFPLQCMKVKSESEVAQSCPTLWDPMDCSLPGSSVHGISQARALSGVPSPSPHPYMSTGKTIALTIQTFVNNVISLLFNMLLCFVIAFISRSKQLLISWLQSSSKLPWWLRW